MLSTYGDHHREAPTGDEENACMRTHNEINELLKCFDGYRTRRAVLGGLIFAGAGIGPLTRFAGILASASAAEVAELTIFAWPGIVPDILKEHSIAPFSKVARGTTVKLDIATNAAMYPRMLASRSNPVVSGGMFNDIFLQKGVVDRMWVEPNDDWMPNRKSVPIGLLAPGAQGTLFQFTPYGIMYNPDRVDKPTSWADLWNPKYKGRVGPMWDSYFDAYIAAAVMVGKGPSVEEGVRLWTPHKRNIAAWTSSSTKVEDDVARGETWLAPHWGSWCEQARVQGKKLAFTIPKEGAVQWGGHSAAVTGFSPKVTELTQRYLDTWNSEDCQVAWVRKGFFGPANRSVNIPAELLTLEAVMTAEEATRRLIRHDVKAVGERIPQLKALIDRTLKV